ncbi:MAG TPA: helix-turn-helix transcriptional regulator [Candidatus Egerieimonas intestinavium]|uniref:Helix-turn-helix transcriptional regulator n=1 Tax=Candidatus Egerieimonas intestinavium TaxID=2840777 RepID=A0A9D1EI33_9FIRM|nr:helix-turn-helix transcriptional regulator [Candidatus Egerieimonas intestinavium]
MNVKYFPRNLRFLRRINGYTQEEISALLHVCRQTYTNYEHARRFPSVDILLRLSSLFQVPLESLFSPSLPESRPLRPPGLALSPKRHPGLTLSPRKPPGLVLSSRGSAGAGLFAPPSPAASPRFIYRSAALAA